MHHPCSTRMLPVGGPHEDAAMAARPERTYTAFEANRSFGRIQEEAAQSPVILTHHGRPRTVILSIEEYDRLIEGRAEPRDESARAQRRKLLMILDTIQEAYLSLDREWRYVTINRAAELYLGQPRDDLVGQVWTDAFPALRGSEAEEQLARAMHQGEAVSFIWSSAVHPARRVEVRAFPLPLPEGGIGVLFRNVSERERLERRLREVEARLKAIESEVDDRAIIAFDADGAVRSWSRGAEHMLGWNAGEILGQSIERIVTPEQREAGAIWSDIAKAHRDGRLESTAIRQTKDGATIRLRCMLAPLQANSDSYLSILRRDADGDALHAS